MEDEQAKAAPPEKPGSVEAELVAAKRLERIAKEKEEKIPLDKVPEAVMKAAKAKVPGLKVTEAEKETVDAYNEMFGLEPTPYKPKRPGS